ncbi:MAG: hypothetical protein COS84_04975 [Armatimonadetes bacterium CG07_land_8_20_14_0_80_40_9]|nr:MAG: hypothetical protein COS84_04975 [Armatimonadetes bacterium CG07_land_8_20_14_0_80_40_9]
MRKRAKILVIEDNQTILELIKVSLEDSGYEVITADKGGEGIIKARKERPDLITLDVSMQPINGGMVLTALKGDSLTSSVPVILISVFEEKKDAIRLTTNGYVSKPFKIEKLLKTVKETLDKKRKTDR